MLKIQQGIDRFNAAVGKWSSWFSSFLVILIFADVFFRYVFKASAIWISELGVYFFAILLLLSSAYAFQKDQHVRVDVLYTRFSVKQKAWVNLIGCALFLAPWIIVAIKFSAKYAWSSWLIKETSSNPGGLPMLYLLKFILLLSFILLALQTIARMIKSVLIIIQRT